MTAARPDPHKLRAALEVAAEQIQKQKVIIEAQNELLHWALGDGPLPCDEEAERAAWGYLRALAIDGGYRALMPYLQRTKGLLTTRCPDAFEAPTMLWSEVMERLERAAMLRWAARATREAARALYAGDTGRAIERLRAAAKAIGHDARDVPRHIGVAGEEALAAWIRMQPEAIALAAEVRGLRVEAKELRGETAELQRVKERLSC